MSEGKPEWAQMAAKARRLVGQARRLEEMAERRRCPSRESGGERCTRDAGHEPGHRIWNEDRP